MTSLQMHAEQLEVKVAVSLVVIAMYGVLLLCSAYGSLTVRSLLDTREHCLEEFHFGDPYSQVNERDLIVIRFLNDP